MAINGGPKALSRWPVRRLFTTQEKTAAAALFDRSLATGDAFGYDGPDEEAYCKEFARFLGGGYADAVNSGTSAVYVALRALELEPFGEVICPPITDPGGVMPVPLCNLIPIPADSALDSYNAGPDQIEARITRHTRAIIVAHIAGIPAEIGPIMEVAKARDLPVIEDCAQAHGARYKGRHVGTWGTLGAFSTMSGKHHATAAQGGVVFTRDEALYWMVRRYSDRGKPFNLPATAGNVVCSLNFNLNDLAACVGRAQLKRLPKIIAARQKIATLLARECRRLATVRLMPAPRHAKPSPWFLFCRLQLDRLSCDKATFVKAVAAEGIPVSPSYFHLFTEHPWYKNRAVFGTSGYPWTCPMYKGNADKLYLTPNIRATDARHFALSFHENLTPTHVRRIVAGLRKVEKAYLK
ncbi:MAG: DegT/DnrJ/EryC1/StrS family aminotransferase [Candidatus Brocadiia bacterium]